MKINDMLKGLDCSCGKHHSCPVKAVYVERGAIERLSEIFPEEKVLVVCDENTFRAAGKETLAALSGKDVRRITFPGTPLLVPDEKAIAAVEEELGDAQALIGIGSGVIQDLCKYVSFDRGIPYAVVATAPSMDGYASDGAAMILGGMKVTVKAGLPRAILADPAILKNAPMELIRAGFGDIVGKYSALNDWKLSQCINGEYFCQEIYDMTMEQVHRTVALSQGILNRDETAIGTIMEALIIVGILMSFATSSRPASGSEHHLSHYFEITGLLEGKDYFPHGIDVAYSTVVTAGLREKLLSRPLTPACDPVPVEVRQREVSRVYGPSAPGCMALQEKVGHYDRDRLSVYVEKEAEIRAILSEMPSAREIEKILGEAGYDMQEFYDFYGLEKIQDAVVWAKDLKDRFTVLWLNYDLYGGKMA